MPAQRYKVHLCCSFVCEWMELWFGYLRCAVTCPFRSSARHFGPEPRLRLTQQPAGRPTGVRTASVDWQKQSIKLPRHPLSVLPHRLTRRNDKSTTVCSPIVVAWWREEKGRKPEVLWGLRNWFSTLHSAGGAGSSQWSRRCLARSASGPPCRFGCLDCRHRTNILDAGRSYGISKTSGLPAAPHDPTVEIARNQTPRQTDRLAHHFWISSPFSPTEDLLSLSVLCLSVCRLLSALPHHHTTTALR